MANTALMRLVRILAILSSTALPAALPAAVPAPPPETATEARAEAESNLANMALTLGRQRPYRFELHYRGPTMPFRGPLCYGFAGYNETCTALELSWLTPATTIELWAPGGVPRDLLQGYVMLVRYPAMADRTYRYPLEPGPEEAGSRDRP